MCLAALLLLPKYPANPSICLLQQNGNPIARGFWPLPMPCQHDCLTRCFAGFQVCQQPQNSGSKLSDKLFLGHVNAYGGWTAVYRLGTENGVFDVTIVFYLAIFS